jgi:hypothetical protein
MLWGRRRHDWSPVYRPPLRCPGGLCQPGSSVPDCLPSPQQRPWAGEPRAYQVAFLAGGLRSVAEAAMEWLRWPAGFVCPGCGHIGGWRLGDGRLRRAGCSARTSVTAGTLFDRTRTPLTVWFTACWLFATQKDGVSALSLQRALEIGSYQTAWAMLHRLRSVLVRPGARVPQRVRVSLQPPPLPQSGPGLLPGAWPSATTASDIRTSSLLGSPAHGLRRRHGQGTSTQPGSPKSRAPMAGANSDPVRLNGYPQTALYAAGLLQLEKQPVVGHGALPPGSHSIEVAVFVRASRSELSRSPRRRQLGLAGALSSDLELAVRPDAR